MSQCQKCPHCSTIDQNMGSMMCAHCESKKLEFMTSRSGTRGTATIINRNDCRFGVVSKEHGTVVQVP